MADCSKFLSYLFADQTPFLTKSSEQIRVSIERLNSYQSSSPIAVSSDVQTRQELAEHASTRNDDGALTGSNEDELQDKKVSSQISNHSDLDVEMGDDSCDSIEIPVQARLKTVKSENTNKPQDENVTVTLAKTNKQADDKSCKVGSKRLFSFFNCHEEPSMLNEPIGCELGETSHGNKGNVAEHCRDNVGESSMENIGENSRKNNAGNCRGNAAKSCRGNAEENQLGNTTKENYKDTSVKKTNIKDCNPSTDAHAVLSVSTESRGNNPPTNESTKKNDSSSLIEKQRNDRPQKEARVSSASTDENLSGDDDSESFERFSKMKEDSGTRKKRTEWTSKEEEAVYVGVQKHGPKWAKIAPRLPGRTNVNIKDKWRTMLRQQGRLAELARIFGPIN